MTNSSNQVKGGAILSYILIFINFIYGMVITPYILAQLGSSEYGVYKTIASFSNSLMVLDLGIGTTVMRYVAKYKAEGNIKNIENFTAMSLIQTFCIWIIVAAASVIMYCCITPLYSNTFTASEISTAKQIFIVLAITMCAKIFENVLFGITSGYNRFIFSNGMKILLILSRSVLFYILLRFFKNAIVITLIDLFITLCIIAIQFIYIHAKLNIKIKLYFWDKLVFIESFKYTFLMFIQTIVIQVNGNLDNIVIGAVISTNAVTVYSFGILMFNMYESLATSFSNLMLPTVSERIHNGATRKDLEDIVIKTGRIQFIILGAALAGFILIGKDFIKLWLGSGFDDVWLIGIILMIPVTIPLIQNVCLSILRVENKMKFRTISLIGGAVFNLIFTIIGTMHFGYIAAAFGTAASTVIGSIIAMNIYYKVKLNINVLRIFKEIFKKTLLCICAASLALLTADRLLPYISWHMFIIKVLVFCISYGILLLAYGLNRNEKQMLFTFKSKIK